MKETIKSQHELTKPQERQSDVLIKALEKCEKLEKENKQYRSALMAIEIETTSLGGSKKDMINSLLIIDDICRRVLD